MAPELSPSDLLLRGRHYHREGRFDEARQALARAAALLDDAPSHAAYGRLLVDCEELPDAIAELARARELAPLDAPLLLSLGEALFQEGRYDEAAEAFGQAASCQTDIGARPAQARAVALALAGRTEEASAELVELAERCPDDPEILLSLAQVRGRGGPSEQAAARTVLEGLLAREPDHLQARYELAMLLARAKEQDPSLCAEAVAQFGLLLAARGFPEQLPDAYLAHYAVGTCYDDTPEGLDRAEAHYRACLRLRPRFAPALANLGAVLQRKDRPLAAFHVSAQAVHADPLLLPALHNLGRLCHDIDDEQVAAALIDAIGLDRLQASCVARLVRAASEHAVAESHAVLCEAIHRVKNRAGVAAGRLGALASTLAEANPDAAEEAQVVRDLADRIYEDMREVLGLLRPSPEEMTLVQVDEVIAGVCALLAGTAPPNVRVRHVPAPEPIALRANAERLRDLLLHLAHNALAAMPTDGSGGVVLFGVRPCNRREGWVVIEVSDTGAGIPAEHLRDIRTPGVSLRPGGTGLGLWICEQIARAHGGSLSLTSDEGRGTTVLVELPRSGQGVQAARRLRIRQVLTENPLDFESAELSDERPRVPRLAPGGGR